MKKYLTLAILTLLLTACGGDDVSENNTPTPPTPPTPTITVTLEGQSIADGAEVDAKTISALVLLYNVNVQVSAKTDITLNGTKMFAQKNATSNQAIDIPLKLQEGMEYTLEMTEGSVVAADDATAKAPAFTLKFKTKAAEPNTYTIPAEPLTASTPAAKRLYSYFLSQYGRKTISSVMADVNWNNNCAEKVHQLTGKYPAMNCYDFIHILYSPSNWIDYTSIKPVQDWADAGGIVQLMWHFNVPKYEGSTDATCTPSETTFRARNVFTDGTWEHRWFYEQMDKVVATLLKLQDAGIAATWRPFHEAAGNATYRQQADWTTSWFWWGYDGAEIYKRLWTTMFDYFRQKGINNLIWVWTTQNYNGDASKYRQDTDWYPGDQYVDLVARDLYGCTAQQNKQEYIEIQTCYPTKMIVLGECGRDGYSNREAALPGDYWSAGALWGHFMVWYQQQQGSTDTMCSDSWWKSAMSNPNVITRDEVPNLK